MGLGPSSPLGSTPHAALLGIGAAASAAGAAGLLFPDSVRGVPALLALVSGASLAGLTLSAFRVRRLADALRRESAASTQLEQKLMSQNLSLRSQVEILTAMREVSRLTLDERELDRLAPKVFALLEGLLGADEITLYLRDPETELFHPRLHQSGGKLFARKDLASPEAKRALPPRKIDASAFLQESEGSLCTLSVPLTAEGETLGLLSAGFHMEGEETDEARMEQRESVLKDLSKHIALAVRTLSLHTEAIQDGLTGLFTKREFDNRLAYWVEWSAKCGDPLSLVLLDIDHFKQINDQYGHPVGDEVLRRIGRLVRRTIRGTDSAYRYGGEEISVILPQADPAKAERAAERLRKGIEKEEFPLPDGGTLKVTASAGIACFPAEEGPAGDPLELVRRADTALYRAKHEGRNRVCAAQEVPESSPSAAEPAGR